MSYQEGEPVTSQEKTGSTLWRTAIHLPSLPTPTLWRKTPEPEALCRLLLAQFSVAQQMAAKGIRPFPAKGRMAAPHHNGDDQPGLHDQRVKPAPGSDKVAAQQQVHHSRHLDYEQTHPDQHNFTSRFRDR